MAKIKLYNWSRSCPAPFDGMPKSSTAAEYHSIYSSSYTSVMPRVTLCAPILKALAAIVKMERRPGVGGVGYNKDFIFAEYVSSTGMVHLVSYSLSSHKISARIKDCDTGAYFDYGASNSAKEDGTAFFISLYLLMKKDEEFNTNFDTFRNHYVDWLDTGMVSSQLKQAAYILCDNVYRRIENGDIPVEVDTSSGYLPRIQSVLIDMGKFIPDEVECGEFTVFSTSGAKKAGPASIGIGHESFVGKYDPDPDRVLSENEEMLVPVLSESDIVDKDTQRICQIVKTSKLRNFLLVGPAGSGKSTKARLVAAGIRRPFYLMCLNAGTTSEELLGFIRMELKDENGEEREECLPITKIIEGVCKGKYISIEDMYYNPEEIYEAVFDEKIDEIKASSENLPELIFEKLVQKAAKKIMEMSGDNRKFLYQDTPLVQAIRNGGVVEIQEPTVVIQQGVLVALNSLLEEGIINLPNGEVIKRHPDCVVILTTNQDYNGCRGMNQSFVDRCVPIMCPTPTKEDMMQRVMKKTGEDDTELVSKMTEVVLRMKQYCSERGIEEGEVGYRCLERWVTLNQILNDPYLSATMSVIPAASLNPADQEEVSAAVVEPVFAKYK